MTDLVESLVRVVLAGIGLGTVIRWVRERADRNRRATGVWYRRPRR